MSWHLHSMNLSILYIYKDIHNHIWYPHPVLHRRNFELLPRIHFENTQTHFYFFPDSSHEDRREVKATKAGVAELPLTPDTQVNIIIHGYTESSFRTWVLNLTDGKMMLSEGGREVMQKK